MCVLGGEGGRGVELAELAATPNKARCTAAPASSVTRTCTHTHLARPSSSVIAAKKALVMAGAMSTWSRATLENTASGDVGSPGHTYCRGAEGSSSNVCVRAVVVVGGQGTGLSQEPSRTPTHTSHTRTPGRAG